MTPTYKDKLGSYSGGLYLCDIRDPTNLQNEEKIIALVVLEPDIRKVMFRVT